MRELPVEWSEGKWTYTQVSRHGDVAIYRQKHKEGPAERFEVVLVQHLAKDREMPHGRVIEAGEYYPGASVWGTHGWTHFTLAEAQAQASELVARGTES